jgi:hypothetical protein
VQSAVGLFNDPWRPRPFDSGLFWVPPVWFLGLYEWMLGGADPVFRQLAATAAIACVTVAAVTVASYLAVYRRVLVRVVETPEGGGAARLSAAFELVTRAIARAPARRASAQFLFVSLGRVERLRFVVAIMAGVVGAWIVPAVLVYATHRDTPVAPVTTYALSYVTLVLVLAGLRVAVAMPADLRAAWVNPVVGAPGSVLRSGLWRALYTMGVVPVSIAFGALHLALFGVASAASHLAVMLALGAALVELALWHFDDMACQRPWRPEQANLRAWWPVYLIAFGNITGTLPRLEVSMGPSTTGPLVLVLVSAAAAVALRLAHRRPYPSPDVDTELTVEVPSVLRLE